MLVVAVIFIFLRSVTATIISSLTLPVTMVATFAVMYLLNYSLDNLSLMALTLSVGFVVDNTIVMLENIVRHMEMGKSPMQAAFDGSKEVAFTIVAMTVVAGGDLHPGPVHGRPGRAAARRVRGHDRRRDHRVGLRLDQPHADAVQPVPEAAAQPEATAALYNLTERMFDGWLRAYDWSLRLSLRYRAVTMAASLLLLAGSAYLFMLVPKGFLPSEDQDRFNISVEGIQGIGFEEMLRHQMEVADIVAQDPDIIGFSNNVGGGGGGGGGGGS